MDGAEEMANAKEQTVAKYRSKAGNSVKIRHPSYNIKVVYTLMSYLKYKI